VDVASADLCPGLLMNAADGGDLRFALVRDWLLRVRQTVVLPDSQPEPDFAIVRGTPRSYLTRNPCPSDISTVVEVADASLLRDQCDKTSIYARAGIPCYWIVNLEEQRLHVYSRPTGPITVPAFQSFQIYQPGDDLPLVLDGAMVGTVPVAELLP